MDQERLEAAAIEALRRAGARFGFVHGSRAGTGQPDAHPVMAGSDLDVAAWWGEAAPDPWDVLFDDGAVDLLVLDRAPLELAGRVAVWGRLLFDDAPEDRIAWQARTRLVYLDEEGRQRTVDRLFMAGVRARGR